MGRKKRINKKTRLIKKVAVDRLVSQGVKEICGRHILNCKTHIIFKKFYGVFKVSAEDYFNSTKKERRVQRKKERVDNSPKGYVYFIGNISKGYVKIGFSKTPRKRLRAIQTGCPFIVEILYLMEGSMYIENKLHKKFFKHKSYGEWFHASDEIIKFCEETPEVEKQFSLVNKMTEEKDYPEEFYHSPINVYHNILNDLSLGAL